MRSTSTPARINRVAGYTSLGLTLGFVGLMSLVDPQPNASPLSIVMRAAHLLSASFIVTNVVVSLLMAPYASLLEAIAAGAENEKCVPLTGARVIPGFSDGPVTTTTVSISANTVVEEVLAMLTALRRISMVACVLSGFYFTYRDWMTFASFAIYHALFDAKIFVSAILFILLEASWTRSSRFVALKQHRKLMLWICLALSVLAYLLSTALRAYQESISSN